MGEGDVRVLVCGLVVSEEDGDLNDMLVWSWGNSSKVVEGGSVEF